VWGFDFAAYWTAAGRVAAGGSPYAPTVNQAGSFLAYLYPPPLAVAFAPMAGLGADYHDAAWPWLVVRALFAVAALVVLLRYIGMKRGEIAVITVAVMALPAVAWDLIMGNVNLLLMAMLAVAWLGLRSGRAGGETAAGALIGLATLIKVFPALLIVWLLLTRRIRGAVVSVLVILGVALATLPVVGISGWTDYLRVVTDLAGPGGLTAFSILGPIVILAGLVAAAWSTLQHPPWVSFSVCILAAMLLSPTLVATYLALAVLPLILLLAYSRSQWPAIACYVLVFIAGMLEFEAGPMDILLARVLTTATIVAILVALFWAGRHSGGRQVRCEPATAEP
jgi:Glycosyltransferase family 87